MLPDGAVQQNLHIWGPTLKSGNIQVYQWHHTIPRVAVVMFLACASPRTRFHGVCTTWQPFGHSLAILAPTPLVCSENEHAITPWQSPKKDLPDCPIAGSINSCQGSRAQCVNLNSFSSGWSLDQGCVRDWLWLICIFQPWVIEAIQEIGLCRAGGGSGNKSIGGPAPF